VCRSGSLPLDEDGFEDPVVAERRQQARGFSPMRDRDTEGREDREERLVCDPEPATVLGVIERLDSVVAGQGPQGEAVATFGRVEHASQAP
jgi:hypothetical protein